MLGIFCNSRLFFILFGHETCYTAHSNHSKRIEALWYLGDGWIRLYGSVDVMCTCGYDYETLTNRELEDIC